EAPKTIEELISVAKAFVEQDPDGNGNNDTYGISMDQTFGYVMDAIGAALKGYPKVWIEDSEGKLVYGSIQPEMKETLRVMNELYQLKAFNPEFAVNNAQKEQEEYTEGKVGIVFGPFFRPGTLRNLYNNVPDAEWKA